MNRIIKYYYTGYYKFFSSWQSDDDAARNAKGAIALPIGFFVIMAFDKLYELFTSKKMPPFEGNFKVIGYLITLPTIAIVMMSIKTFYPNDVPRNLVRGIIVSITFPLVIVIYALGSWR